MKKMEKMRAILAKKRSTIVRCLAAGYFLIAVLMMIILEDGRLPGFLMIGIGRDWDNYINKLNSESESKIWKLLSLALS